MRLGGTTEILELQTGAAQSTDWQVSYVDIDAASSAAFEADGNVTTATTTTIVGAPASGIVRQIQWLLVRNKGAASQTITIKKDIAGTERLAHQAILAPGESFEWSHNSGAKCYDTLGSLKRSLGNQVIQVGLSTRVILASDVTNNNAVANTIADVTGLSFAVNAGEKYWFHAVVMYTAAATTTGSRWSINCPASPTQLMYQSEYSLTATTKTFNSGLAAVDLPAASSASSAATNSNLAIIEGYVLPSASGTVIVRFASEIASSAIVAKAGSVLEWIRVA